jgi:very-short-patch-repair endonuclease
MKRATTEHARQLRKNLTDAEQRLWRRLRYRQLNGHKFRRQQPIGPYIVDFVCFENRVVVELDGGQHAGRSISDEKRTRWLEAQGFHVVRFWNHEVLTDVEVVLTVINQALGFAESPHPVPPPQVGRE